MSTKTDYPFGLSRNRWQSQLHPVSHFILLQSEQIFLFQYGAVFTISIELSDI